MVLFCHTKRLSVPVIPDLFSSIFSTSVCWTRFCPKHRRFFSFQWNEPPAHLMKGLLAKSLVRNRLAFSRRRQEIMGYFVPFHLYQVLTLHTRALEYLVWTYGQCVIILTGNKVKWYPLGVSLPEKREGSDLAQKGRVTSICCTRRASILSWEVRTGLDAWMKAANVLCNLLNCRSFMRTRGLQRICLDWVLSSRSVTWRVNCSSATSLQYSLLIFTMQVRQSAQDAIRTAQSQLRRSMLYVPSSFESHKLERNLNNTAFDSVCCDLEDSVSYEQKGKARSNAFQLVLSPTVINDMNCAELWKPVTCHLPKD